MVNKWDTNIRTQEEDLKDYEQDLQAIYEPFKGVFSIAHGKPDYGRQEYRLNHVEPSPRYSEGTPSKGS